LEVRAVCDCEFDPYEDGEADEESWHFKRTCAYCGTVWWGLHCPHDGAQNPCPGCKKRPMTAPDPEDAAEAIAKFLRWATAPS
jgi:hypothetical protein